MLFKISSGVAAAMNFLAILMKSLSLETSVMGFIPIHNARWIESKGSSKCSAWRVFALRRLISSGMVTSNIEESLEMSCSI